MQKNDYYTNFNKLKDEPSISWVYGQVYGGGSDEHHAIFYAKEAKYTDKLSSYLEKELFFHAIEQKIFLKRGKDKLSLLCLCIIIPRDLIYNNFL